MGLGRLLGRAEEPVPCVTVPAGAGETAHRVGTVCIEGAGLESALVGVRFRASTAPVPVITLALGPNGGGRVHAHPILAGRIAVWGALMGFQDLIAALPAVLGTIAQSGQVVQLQELLRGVQLACKVALFKVHPEDLFHCPTQVYLPARLLRVEQGLRPDDDPRKGVGLG